MLGYLLSWLVRGLDAGNARGSSRTPFRMKISVLVSICGFMTYWKDDGGGALGYSSVIPAENDASLLRCSVWRTWGKGSSNSSRAEAASSTASSWAHRR